MWLLQGKFPVRTIGVCGVIPHGISMPHALSFLHNALVLNQYVGVVLDHFPNVFCWCHAEFNSPYKDLYLRDGVHVNPTGQYFIYFTGVIVAPFLGLWVCWVVIDCCIVTRPHICPPLCCLNVELFR